MFLSNVFINRNKSKDLETLTWMWDENFLGIFLNSNQLQIRKLLQI